MRPVLLSIFSLVLLIIAVGCSSTDGNTWLIRTTEEEITVAEAGAAWLDLDEDAREGFLQGDNPVGDFITTLARKTMIIAEISNDEYLFAPVIQAMRDAWIRNACFYAYRDELQRVERENVSQQDLENYRLLIGKLVWYTDESGSYGPERLPDLPWDIAFAFDTIQPGQSVTIDNELLTLDSVTVSPDSLIEVTLADTARVNAFATSALVEKRVGNTLDSISSAVSASLSIDSAAVQQFCSSSQELPDSTPMAVWDGGELTVTDLQAVCNISAMGLPIAPDSPDWVNYALTNQARLAVVQAIYQEHNPTAYQEIFEESESFAMEQAGELLFQQSVASRIEITEEMITEAYSNLDSLPTVPEARVFESVNIPSTELEASLSALEEGQDPRTFGFPGYAPYLAQGSEFISRPVQASELPSDLGTLLFLLPEDNTDWQRPLELAEGTFTLFRLDSVIPPHDATIDQMRREIIGNLEFSLTEQFTMDWLCEMEQEHGLEINSGILSDLPGDPAMWLEL